MKIALIGYGKMGQMIEKLAHPNGDEIVARFSRQNSLPTIQGLQQAGADVVIDFTQSSAVLDHLKLCLSIDKPLVIGTTGWENDLPKAKEMVLSAQGSCLYAPNFSLGVYLFQHIVSYAASLFHSFSDYDVSGIEYHHNQKLDQPSGTAKLITQDLLQHIPRLQNFAFTSVRCGHIPGTHTLHFDSPVDTVTLTHEARSREGFAQGALQAAQWLVSRKGFFTLDDMMQERLQGEHA